MQETHQQIKHFAFKLTRKTPSGRTLFNSYAASVPDYYTN